MVGDDVDDVIVVAAGHIVVEVGVVVDSDVDVPAVIYDVIGCAVVVDSVVVDVCVFVVGDDVNVVVVHVCAIKLVVVNGRVCDRRG